MYLEKEAIDYFRKYDIIYFLVRSILLDHPGDIPSRKIGRNLEFEQYKEYIPGDSLKDVDWKVFSRTDKLFVKNYQSDVQSRIRIIIDNSESMNFPDKNSKLENAKKTTAIFYHLLSEENCIVNLSVINSEYYDYKRLNNENIEDILLNIKPQGKTDIKKINILDKKEIVFLLSDGWWGNDFEDNIRFLINNRINFLLILSEKELELDYKGNCIFLDSENLKRIDVIPSEIKQRYKKAIKNRINLLRESYIKSQLLFDLFINEKKYYINLKQFLESRKQIKYYNKLSHR